MANVKFTDTHDVERRASGMQERYFRTTDQVPGEVWYWAALSSIAVSAVLFLMGRRDWSIFTGQWAPTFILFGVFHKLIHSR